MYFGAALFWVTIALIEVFFKSRNISIALSSIEYLGAGTAPAFSLFFAIENYQVVKKVNDRWLYLVLGAGFLFLLIGLTNDSFHLFWKDVVFHPGPVFEYVHGPMFYVYAVYSFMCTVTTMAVIFSTVIRESRYRLQGSLLVFGGLISWWSGILYAAGWNPFSAYDTVPVSNGFGAILILFSIKKTHLLKECYKSSIGFSEQPAIGSSLHETPKNELREALGVAIMKATISLWCEVTGKTKADFAEESKIWSFTTNENGWRRTQTLDRYLEIEKLPKFPKWNKVLASAEFVLSLPQLKGTNEEPQSSVKLAALVEAMERFSRRNSP